MTFTFDPTKITTDLAKVRTMIADTDEDNPLLTDEQINFFVSVESNIYLASAMCCEAISSSYAGQVDTKVGDLAISKSQKSKQYKEQADRFRLQAKQKGGAQLFAGGISISSKDTYEDDSDRVEPAFSIGQFDNDTSTG